MGTLVNVSANNETLHSHRATGLRSLSARRILLAGAFALATPLLWAGAAYAGCSAG
jgi:hypothetical protein